MAKIIMDSYELENNAAKVSNVTALVEGVLLALEHGGMNSKQTTMSMLFALQDYSKILSDELYDIFNKAPEITNATYERLESNAEVKKPIGGG